jgi:hypothetical protein
MRQLATRVVITVLEESAAVSAVSKTVIMVESWWPPVNRRGISSETGCTPSKMYRTA